MSADKQQHMWYYTKSGFMGSESQEGPISEQALMQLARDGGIRIDTSICSPTRTGGEWIVAQQLAKLAALINEGNAARAQKKALAKREAAAPPAVVDSVARPAPPPVPTTEATDSPEAHSKIKEKIAGILTRGETITFIVLQAKPIAIKADAAVCTTRRLIVFRPKMLGRFDFEDFLWHELQDAHLKQGVVGSTFTAKHVSGKVITLEWLPKEGARELYRYAQEMEEKALHTRRQMDMEVQAAGAAKINIAQVAPTAGATPAMADPVAKLQQLKQMLDSGLITAEDFEAKKQKLLADM